MQLPHASLEQAQKPLINKNQPHLMMKLRTKISTDWQRLIRVEKQKDANGNYIRQIRG